MQSCPLIRLDDDYLSIAVTSWWKHSWNCMFRLGLFIC